MNECSAGRHPAPDWGRWSNRGTVFAWEACALSLNIEPDSIDLRDWLDPDEIEPEARTFRDRLRQLGYDLADRGYFKPGALPLGEPERAEVWLPDFARWCIEAAQWRALPGCFSEIASAATARQRQSVSIDGSPVRLFITELAGRPFGARMVNVSAFLQWVERKGYRLRTDPPIDGYEVAQLEAILNAIELAERVPDDVAARMIAGTALADHPMAEAAPGWLLNADRHRTWRERIEGALVTGELRTLDPVTLEEQPAPQGVTSVSGRASDSLPFGHLEFGEPPAFVERLHELICNGKAIDWTELALDSLTPIQAAQASERIDPWEWPDVNKWKQGEVPADVLARIRRLAQRLEAIRERWTLAQLVEYLGDKAPAGMRDAVGASTPTQTVPEPEIAAVSPPLVDSSVQHGAEKWRVLPMTRADDLRSALHAFLSAADKTREPPSAREVLSAWANAKPLGIVRVLTDGVDCLAKNGTEERTFGIDAIADRIARLVERLPGQ